MFTYAAYSFSFLHFCVFFWFIIGIQIWYHCHFFSVWCILVCTHMACSNIANPPLVLSRCLPDSFTSHTQSQLCRRRCKDWLVWVKHVFSCIMYIYIYSKFYFPTKAVWACSKVMLNVFVNSLLQRVAGTTDAGVLEVGFFVEYSLA